MTLNFTKLYVIAMALLFTTSAQAQTISTIAGTGTAGYSGDGAAATVAQVNMPSAAAADGSGNVYIADYANNCIRKVNSTGVITTFAGTGIAGFSGDGSAAGAAQLNHPNGVAVDGYGNLYISDYSNNRIRKVNTSGIITTIAGTGTAGYSGSGSAATAARINMPAGVAVDGYLNVYIADNGNQRIRMVNSSGIISDLAGNGTAGFSGDSGPASAAQLNSPHGVAVDGYGFVYVADYGNHRVRQINLSGIINTYAGTGTGGFSGDAGPAIAAQIHFPTGVATDANNYVYIADSLNNRVRKVNATGIITTFAGNGTTVFGGDGGPATAAGMIVANVAADPFYTIIYIPAGIGERVRRVDTGVIAAITGASSVCVGSSITLSDATTGGSWSSSATSIATIGSGTGVVTGVAAGVATIYYTVGGSSVIHSVTVNPLPSPIAGLSTVCVGATITLTDATGGGIWVSTGPVVATVGSASGVVTGMSSGVTTIVYTIPTSCSATRTITVNPLPTITASASYASCGGVYTLTASGGVSYTWGPSTTGLSCSTCSVTSVNPSTSMFYVATGTNGYGCSDTSSVTIDGNRISGYISLSATGSIKVWLIHFNASDSSIIALDSTMACTTTGGGQYYEFMDPPAGNYRVKANLLGGTPGASGYIPTYSLYSPYWYSADTVNHVSSTDTMHVNLVYGTVPAGPGFISGYVVSGAGRGTSGEVPAVGMLVYLKDASNNVLTYAYTSATGTYSFSGLANGTYYVYPEDYKYYTTPSAALILTSSSTSATGVGFKQHTTFGTITPFVVTAIPSIAANKEWSVYPNPSSGELTITGITGNTQYRLLNITGTGLMQGTLQLGSNTLSMQRIASGMYILELTGEHGERSMIRVVKE